ncbi:MAG: FMN-binding protein [Phycisphaerae bacterium]|nr:FMN-binding protein [Phycisphaerae bacterium]MDD5381462.1 FMN-binding protein [Phycisphaerae bacterium]
MLKKIIANYIEQSWLLIVCSFAFGLLLALTNSAWSGRIEQNKIDKLNGLMNSLMTDANKFEIVLEGAQVELGKGKIVKTNVYKAVTSDGKTTGFCFNAEGAGFADKIELVIAVDAAFEKIAGYSVLSSNETPGFGDRIKGNYYRGQFKGAPVGTLILTKQGSAEKIDSDIVAISGATVSSTAVVNIFNNYLEQIKKQLVQKGIVNSGR